MKTKNYKRVIGAVVAITLVVGLLFAVGFTKGTQNKDGKKSEVKKSEVKAKSSLVLVDTYFEFVGALGQEADITQWEATADFSGCGGDNKACKILVKKEFLKIALDEDDDEMIIIDPLELPFILTEKGEVGNHNVPDETLAGPNTDQPIVYQRIYNKS